MLPLDGSRFSPRDALHAACATVALFIAANLVGELIRPPFEVLSEWVTVPGPRWLRAVDGIGLAVALLAASSSRVRDRRSREAAALLVGGNAVFALRDVGVFYVALARGRIHTPAILPASLFAVVAFAVCTVDLLRPASTPRTPTLRRGMFQMATSAAVLAVIPLLQMVTFGPTRYDRPADCAVVLGARVWNTGKPSDALADRVDEAIRLYQRALVRRIVMSGGIDRNNGLSEPEVMQARAVHAGVPAAAILLDEGGVDTASTVRNTAKLMRAEGLETALVVTHYYHEPRVKMLFVRAGIRAYTVPARMRHRLLKEPYFVLREIAAFYHAFVVD